MSDHDQDMDRGHDLVVEESRPKLKRPAMYRVVLLNDDYTPMEFVVEILETLFNMERTRATQVMLEVHTKGKGVCGVYSYEIAETKVAQVMSIASQQQLCSTAPAPAVVHDGRGVGNRNTDAKRRTGILS